MRPPDIALAQELNQKLTDFSQNVLPLPGIDNPANLRCLILQLIDSIRRIKYVDVIKMKRFNDLYIDASRTFFDPLKAASWASQKGLINEAYWLIFITTHFGKNKKSGWSLAREVYRGDGSGGVWDWKRVSTNFLEFRDWLDEHNNKLKAAGSFGNHRKYQSLDAHSNTGTGMAVGSYLEWVLPHRNHVGLIEDAKSQVGANPKDLFDFLYKSMSSVISFGRTAKFDYLTMVGKLGLADIAPKFTYMESATGPKRGAKLLFGGSIKSSLNDRELNSNLEKLDNTLDLFFGMQVLEDALCNWQKSPGDYIHFVG